MSSSIPLDLLDQLNDLLTSDSTSADMLKSVYDPNNDGLISAAQLDPNIILIPLQRGWFL